MDPLKYQRLKEIIKKASRLKGRKRLDYLDQACAQDKELRAFADSMLKYDAADIPFIEISGPGSTNKSTRKSNWFDTTSIFGTLVSKILGTRYRFILITTLSAVFLTVLALWTYQNIRDTIHKDLGEELNTIQDACLLSLEIWANHNMAEVEDHAALLPVRQYTEELNEMNQQMPGQYARLRESFPHRQLKKVLKRHRQWGGYSIWDMTGTCIACDLDTVVGEHLNARGYNLILKIKNGQSVVVPPTHYQKGYVQENLTSRDPYRPMVLFLAPLRDSKNRIIALLSRYQYIKYTFSQIMNTGLFKKTGETYILDRNGYFLSYPRSKDKMVKAGLYKADDVGGPIQRVRVRDPGGDLTQGYKPESLPYNWPYTSLASEVYLHVLENDTLPQMGVISKPYRNYLGREVIGFWRWIPEFEIAAATEIETDEAYKSLNYLQSTLMILFGVLVTAIAVGLISSLSVVRMRKRIKLGEKLGQYTLKKQVGEGGLGNVYLARHVLLKRPTAIKVLKSKHMSREMLRRFELEVQAASLLTHPNTIEIYDYGESAQGVFYYAMEYVEGPTLRDVIKRDGYVNPQRTVHILRQICASLKEAHDIGLIHRDIKPLNIMLCKRGGEFDVVKVLDFGLVKNISQPEMTKLTRGFDIAGTALYMAPERIRHARNIDQRCDIYSLGAVGYYLLCGQHLFDPGDDVDILFKVVNDSPRPYPEFVQSQIPAELETLISDCLAKDPADRPQSVQEIYDRLNNICFEFPWTQTEAARWWEDYQS